MQHSIWLWFAFNGFVLALLLVDLLMARRNTRGLSVRQATWWSLSWVIIALASAAGVLVWQGSTAVQEFLAAYLIEKLLSLDNLLVFGLLLTYFRVPRAQQHRALYLGVIGALAMRAMFILGGVALIRRFDWILYGFAALLIYGGIRLGMRRLLPRVTPDRNPIVWLFRRIWPVTAEFRGSRLFVRQGGSWHATPLMVTVIALEVTDVAFAVDSIPAVLAITTDPFIVYSANVFALLGMRALYFVLIDLQDRIRYLRPALATVLTLVGVKLAAHDLVAVPAWLSLTLIAGIFLLAWLASWWSQHESAGQEARS